MYRDRQDTLQYPRVQTAWRWFVQKEKWQPLIMCTVWRWLCLGRHRDKEQKSSCVLLDHSQVFSVWASITEIPSVLWSTLLLWKEKNGRFLHRSDWIKFTSGWSRSKRVMLGKGIFLCSQLLSAQEWCIGQSIEFRVKLELENCETVSTFFFLKSTNHARSMA